jgi:hypothetical protein
VQLGANSSDADLLLDASEANDENISAFQMQLYIAFGYQR